MQYGKKNGSPRARCALAMTHYKRYAVGQGPCALPGGCSAEVTDCHSQCAHWLRNDRDFHMGCGARPFSGRPGGRPLHTSIVKRSVGADAHIGPVAPALKKSVGGGVSTPHRYPPHHHGGAGAPRPTVGGGIRRETLRRRRHFFMVQWPQEGRCTCHSACPNTSE